MYDLVFVGGGLASCLAAYRLAEQRPELRTLVVESESTLGGNHTWSFFPTDLTPGQRRWIEPLVLHRWPSYEVRFPRMRRRLTSGYCSTNSDHFHALMTRALRERVRLDAPVQDLTPTAVHLADGEVVRSHCVVDGRGPVPAPELVLGFQKFTGLELRTQRPHQLESPVLMDATVSQGGDYRFVYTLPLDATRLLVEDTRYSDHPRLDPETDDDAIEAYTHTQGWRTCTVVRREQGALPITLAGDIDAFWGRADGMPRIGLRAALFHATTGYSFADAVRTADAIAAAGPLSTPAMFELLRARSTEHWQRQGFWRLLNRLLFIAAEPEERWRVMQRFYGLGQPLIERFYAGRSTRYDKARVLTGKPPVSFWRALRCIPEASAFDPALAAASRRTSHN